MAGTAKTRGTDTVRLLLADDDPIARQAIRTILISAGKFEIVAEAEDGKSAVEQVVKHKPDVLLLDLLMPHLPGLEALRRITTTEGQVRTVVLTSSLSTKQVLEALQLGARGILLKKHVSELMPCLEAVVSGHYWVEGKAVSNVVQVVRDLMDKAQIDNKGGRQFGLTPRELQIIALITQGAANKEIAGKFGISEDTVKRHLTNIFDKVGMSSRLELALFALEHGIAAR